ncbi:uncharacterized protein LOC131673930 [Phymastichus coffea]|uniref:uncharacterized protein LOC131673930 n=1 Tax=Phymastichus coffea TaxID=108790 RepID=UPI00273A92FD|nr:uncharacterized protein LOC131673930 [Phymastichus coffea]
MSDGYPKLPRAAVRDSFDEEDLSDVDDEVFIRDGKNGILKIDDDCGVKRPLMAPRRKCKAHFTETPQISYKTLFAPFCYTLIGFAIILGIIILCIIIITRFPMPMNVLKNWLLHNKPKTFDKQHIVPCTSLNSKVQWTRTLPKLTSEAPLKSNDVNGDNFEDIIVGFSTGLDKTDVPDYVCTLYFDQASPCLGGVLALDGKTGETIWTHWAPHAIFSVDCGLDLTGDKTKDCIIAGRGGILHAINGQDGASIWELPYRDLSMLEQQRYYDVYDARYIADVDDDGIGDIIASHTWQNDKSQSEVVLVSGKTGTKIKSMDFPDNERLFVAPEVLVHPDGETYFILASSDQDKSGGLYVISHSNLLNKQFKLKKLHHGKGRGVSLPPLLIDINSDGTEDIIVAFFNSSVMAFDGLTFKEIWNFTIANSEIISIPVPGYYNDDKVPDFMVKHQIGPGFPVYYYTTATILDGKTGKPILESPMEDTLSAQMSGLSVTVDGYGNDWFLHWSANCLGKEVSKDKYEFIKEASTEADLCKLRFNSTMVTSLLAFSQHVQPPGLALYNSQDWQKVEFNNSIDPKKVAEEYANSHANFENAGDQVNKYSDDRRKTIQHIQQSENFYPRGNIKYGDANEEQQDRQGFLDKELDEMSEDDARNNKWENEKPRDNDVQSDVNYDYNYDDVEKRMLASQSQLNEIRFQRSEKNFSTGRYINNDTNDVENQLDPSMDYTNGQSKNNNYYTNINRSNNAEENVDYMIPDIDFVDNIKDAEALDDRKKRESRIRRDASKSNQRVRKKQIVKFRNSIAKIVSEYRLEAMFNKRLKREETSAWVKPVGMQRQPPTGILVPSLTTEGKSAVDLVFSTFWLPPSSTPFLLLPQDLECIKEAEDKSSKKLSPAEREVVVSECLTKRGIDYQSFQEATDKENSRITLGQMTVYRMRLQCNCPEDMLAGQKCRDISKQQNWPEFLGPTGNGYFEPMKD